MLVILSTWEIPRPGDVNQDGIVGISDILTVLAWWGS